MANKDKAPEEEDDPIGALLDDVPDAPACDDGAEDFMAALVDSASQPTPAPRPSAVRAAVPRRSQAAASQPVVSSASKTGATTPSTGLGRELDHTKITRLTLAGCSLGVALFLGPRLLTKAGPLAGPPLSQTAQLVDALGESLGPQAEHAKDVAQRLREATGTQPRQIPEKLEAAQFPGRTNWNQLLSRPGAIARESSEVQADFEALATELAGIDQGLQAAGLAPAYVHSASPHPPKDTLDARLERWNRELSGLVKADYPAPPQSKGAAVYLAALRDVTQTISRRRAGPLLDQLIELAPALGWSVQLAPNEPLLGGPPPAAGDVSPLALATALTEVLRADAGARAGSPDIPAMHRAAAQLLAGFPAPPDTFGLAWTRAATRLYLLAGMRVLATLTVDAFLEKAARRAETHALGTAALAELYAGLGADAPADAAERWDRYHGGRPPRSAGWWTKLPPHPVSVNGLQGLLPDETRLRSEGKHAGPSERERGARYDRFRRRRGRRRRRRQS